jgi:hypothetical protein
MKLPYEYSETEQFEKGFAEYYKRNILPLADKHEPIREKNKIKNYFNMLCGGCCGLGASWLVFKSAWFAKAANSNGKTSNILLIPPLFFWWLFVRRPINHYFNAVKTDVLPLALKFMGDFTYSAKGNIPIDLLFFHTGYATWGMADRCEDIITYTKDDSICKIFEKTTKDIKKNIGVLYIYFKFQNSLNVDAIIQSKHNDSQLSFVQNRLRKKRELTQELTYKHEFDDNFELYIKDQVKPIWLTDGFIKELLKLNKLFDKQGLTFSILNNEMFIHLPSHQNLFEAGSCYDHPAINASDIKKLLGELNFVINITDEIHKRGQKITGQSKSSPNRNTVEQHVKERLNRYKERANTIPTLDTFDDKDS